MTGFVSLQTVKSLQEELRSATLLKLAADKTAEDYREASHYWQQKWKEALLESKVRMIRTATGFKITVNKT